MTPEQLSFADYGRLLVGRVPWTFVFEVVLRIGVIYLLLVIAMRVAGHRMASQMTRNELAALVSLAGGVGPAIQDPKNGLLPPMIVASVVIGIQRLVSRMSMKSGRIERLTQGGITVLVSEGALDVNSLRAMALSRQRVLAQLRSEGLTHLGQVERLYLEISGGFTVVRSTENRPGLSLAPTWDHAFREQQEKANGTIACSTCGRLAESGRDDRRCDGCGRATWEPAVVS